MVLTDHRLPAGSWDTHCHVFGPAFEYPWAERRTYTPEEVPRETVFAMHDAIGAERAVIVHPACHGFDMGVTLDAIAATDGRYRGIALVDESMRDAELKRLHAGGIRGIRFNYAPSLGQAPSRETVLALAKRIAPLGWHILFHFDPAAIEGFEPLAAELPVPFVIDHLGRIRAEHGLDQAPFRALLRLARNERCWIKISGADRASSQDHGYDDSIPFAHALIEAIPQRILWGTDFPHPNIIGSMPQEGDLVALLRKFVPDEALRHAILTENPLPLYGN